MFFLIKNITQLNKNGFVRVYLQDLSYCVPEMIHSVRQLLEVKKYVSLEQKSLHIPRVCVDNGHKM
jgi:hypothetical protein